MIFEKPFMPRAIFLLAFLLLVIQLAAAPLLHAQGNSAIIRTEPQNLSVQAGQTYDVPIVLENAFEVFAIDVRMSFDPAVVEVVDANPTLEGVQIRQGSFPKPDFAAFYSADNEAGTVTYVVTQTNPTLPASGTGTVFTLQLRAKAAGSPDLRFDKVEMSNRDGILLDVTAPNQAQAAASATPGNTPTAVLINPTTASESQAATSSTPGAQSATSAAAAGATAMPTPTPLVPPTPLPTGTSVAAPPPTAAADNADPAAGAPAGTVAQNTAGDTSNTATAPAPPPTSLPQAQAGQPAGEVAALVTAQSSAENDPAAPVVVGAAEASQSTNAPQDAGQPAAEQSSDSRPGARLLFMAALLVLLAAVLGFVVLLVRRYSS